VPLLLPEPPDGSVDVVREAIGALAARGELSAALRRAGPGQLAITAPHQVFTLALRDVADAAALEKAQPTGWRYLLEVGDDVVAAVETSEADGKHVLSHVNHGPFVRGTVDALGVAETAAGDRPGVELRLLHVPALYLLALWLRDTSGAAGAIVIPIAPAPGVLEANRPYTSEEFLRAAQEQARSVPPLEPDDARGG
jgi:hypothetical protein